MVRKRMRFWGWVQGVGFRWRARNAAEAFGCTGWVSNEFDGSVLMELQGTEEQIDKVILTVEQGRYVRIENMSAETVPLQDENGFYVR
ncbi:MAG: acylphosphatase [Firmicutes bacterium]|nr:acylphosphatase [Bacillota bacterium]